jgi:hypothetical protein
MVSESSLSPIVAIFGGSGSFDMSSTIIVVALSLIGLAKYVTGLFAIGGYKPKDISL